MLVGPKLAIMVPGGCFLVLVGPKLAVLGPGGGGGERIAGGY